MNRRGTIDYVMAGTLGTISALGASLAWAVQAMMTAGTGPSTPELIMIGFQVIGLGLGAFAVNEARAERRNRETAIDAERRRHEEDIQREVAAREKLGQLEADARTALHKRFDDFLKDRAAEAHAQGVQYGEMKQKLSDSTDRLDRMETKVDKKGSDIAAQVQLHLDGTRELLIDRLGEFNRRLDDYDAVLKTLPRRKNG